MKKRKKSQMKCNSDIMSLKKKSNVKQFNGITLIALVITIIVLLILAGTSIQLISGSNGILTKASIALEANDKAYALEEMELKISHLNSISYEQNMRKATLQEMADGLFADEQIEYVRLKNQEVVTLEPIDVERRKLIFS